MPLYEYRCEACGAEEEALESFSAPFEHGCASCGAPAGMRRQLSKAGFILSGGGWYDSGYGAGPKADAKAGAPAKAAPGDSAPAAAAPAPAAPSSGCAGGCSCH